MKYPFKYNQSRKQGGTRTNYSYNYIYVPKIVEEFKESTLQIVASTTLFFYILCDKNLDFPIHIDHPRFQMNARFLLLISGLFFIVAFLNAQAPSVQLKIKSKSGFLGIGGPRTVKIELSNENREQPLTSENVDSGQYYYFLITPVEDWHLDQDFVKDELSKVNIYQDEKKISIAKEG